MKTVSHVTFYWLTKFHCLIAFSSPNIWQYVCYDCLLTSLWHHKIRAVIKPFLYMTKRSRQTLKYLENKKSFWGEIKCFFHHFYRAFSCQKLSQTWEYAFKKALMGYSRRKNREGLGWRYGISKEITRGISRG